MAAEIKRLLLLRSTNYKDVELESLERLSNLADQQGVTTTSLAGAFDKFMTVSRQHNTAVTSEAVEAFCHDYNRNCNKQKHVTPKNERTLFGARTTWEEIAEDIHPNGASLKEKRLSEAQQPTQRITPYLVKGMILESTAHLQPHGRFGERVQNGEVQATLNAHIDLATLEVREDSNLREGAECTLEVLGHPPRVARFMVDRLEDKALHLERRMTIFEAEIDDGSGARLHPTSLATVQPAVFLGRVCCDTENGQLNPQSILLEGSMQTSKGTRVRLDLSLCPHYRTFPGQVAFVQGVNPSGFCVAASQMLPGLPLPMPRTPMDQLSKYAEATGPQGQSLVIAAGPYTTNENLSYEPLMALLQYCRVARPHILVLLGPFVDLDHPLLRDGLSDESFQEIYHSRVLAKLTAFSSETGMSTKVAMMPSTRDAHHTPVFPQPPLELDNTATMLANPATFRANEVVIGCSTADWLMACAKEEISQAPGHVDRLPALASHLLNQRSYFPMYPPPAGTLLDTSLAAALDLPCSPDILIVPSDLAAFAKLIPVRQTLDFDASEDGKTVCINPGRLTKAVSGGTFAHVHIGALPEALLAASTMPAATNCAVLHQVDQRCRVDIMKI